MRQAIVFLIALVLLAACGGGGGRAALPDITPTVPDNGQDTTPAFTEAEARAILEAEVIGIDWVGTWTREADGQVLDISLRFDTIGPGGKFMYTGEWYFGQFAGWPRGAESGFGVAATGGIRFSAVLDGVLLIGAMSEGRLKGGVYDMWITYTEREIRAKEYLGTFELSRESN